jgi:hypothetical protein
LKSISKITIFFAFFLILLNILSYIRTIQLKKINASWSNEIQDSNYWLYKDNVNIEDFTERVLIEGKVISYNVLEDYWEIVINPIQPDGIIGEFSVSQQLPKEALLDNIYKLESEKIEKITYVKLFEILEGSLVRFEVSKDGDNSYISEIIIKQQ